MRELTLDKLPKKVLAKLDIETMFKASRCVLAAGRLMVFRKLHGKRLTASEVARRTRIHREYCESFLDYLVFPGLLVKRGGRYQNSSPADKCFVEGRSAEWSSFRPEECVRDYEALAAIDDVLTGGRDWRRVLGRERKPDYELGRTDRRWAREFTYALYDLYRPDAEMPAEHLDLSGYSALLDVGGGSGIVSMAMTRVYPQLKACVLELKYVCDAAREIVRKEGMTRRVSCKAGDMNKSLPSGYDVIMFWNIGWIDTRVMKMAYRRLPEGGVVVRSCVPPSRRRVRSATTFIHRYPGVRRSARARRVLSVRSKRRGSGRSGIVDSADRWE